MQWKLIIENIKICITDSLLLIIHDSDQTSFF